MCVCVCVCVRDGESATDIFFSKRKKKARVERGYERGSGRERARARATARAKARAGAARVQDLLEILSIYGRSRAMFKIWWRS